MTRDSNRYGWREDIREGNAVARSVGWRIGIWIGVIVLFVGLIGGGIWAFKVVTSDVKGQGDQTRITNDGRNRVNAQEWFHSQHNLIKATDRQITESATRLTEAKTEPDRLFWRDNLSGQKNRCAQMVGDYNAEANKVSRSKWRDTTLPFQIDTSDTTTDCRETAATPIPEGNPR